MPTPPTYEKLRSHLKKIAILQSTSALLEWDQQTKLPKGAGAYRSEQMTFFAGELHRLRTEEQLGTWLNELSDTEEAHDPNSEMGCTVAHLKKDYDRQVKLSARLVEELARACSEGHQIWVEARRDNDFAKFGPALKTIIKLKQEQADAVGFTDCRYDALLDEFEPGAKTSEVAEILEALRRDLVPLVDSIKAVRRKCPLIFYIASTRSMLRRSLCWTHRRKLALTTTRVDWT